MRSSAGAYNPELRAPLWLGAVAFVAILLALLAAFISVMPRPKPRPSTRTTVVAQPVQPAIASAPSVSATQNRPSLLWPVLVPWAIGLDAAALLGLILVLVVHSNVRVNVGRRT